MCHSVRCVHRCVVRYHVLVVSVCRVVPALLRQASYGTLKIGCYQSIKRTMTPDPRDERLLTNVLAGMVSGAFASAVANPTDVLKVRMQAAHDGRGVGPTARGSVLLSFANMYREEGMRGLYRVSHSLWTVFCGDRLTLTDLPSSVGCGPDRATGDGGRRCHLACVRPVQATPPAARCHERCSTCALCVSTATERGMGPLVPCSKLVLPLCRSSVVASFCAAVASNPIDVIKTRMMNQRTNSPHLYRTSLDCLVKVGGRGGARRGHGLPSSSSSRLSGLREWPHSTRDLSHPTCDSDHGTSLYPPSHCLGKA